MDGFFIYMTKKQNFYATLILIIEYNIILAIGFENWVMSPIKYSLLSMIGTLILCINYFIWNSKKDEKEV